MGACGSKPSGCVGVRGGRLNLGKKGRIRRRRRRTKTQSFSNKLNKVEPSHSTDLSYRNPTYQGTRSIFQSPPFFFWDLARSGKVLSFSCITLYEIRIMVGSSCGFYCFFELGIHGAAERKEDEFY